MERLSKVLGEPGLLEDERFRTKDSRAQHEEAFRTQLLKRLATRVLYLEGGEIRVDAPVAQFFDAAAPNNAQPFLKGEMAWA